MRFSSVFIAISGLAVAGGSVYAARDYIEAQATASATTSPDALVKVLVAGRDILLGQPIEPHMLTTIDWPIGSAPAGIFTDAALLLPGNGGEPRRALRAISQGELILANNVSEFGEKVTIVQSLTDGSRAMAIEVNAETAVGGFVTPGDYVDIVLTHGREETLRAVTILQGIRVIGVDQDADEQSDSPEIARTVTVEVTPEQGQRLALAQQAGTLSLALRTQSDAVDEPLEAIQLSDLLQDKSPVAEETPTAVILVRRGNIVTDDQTN